MKRIQSACICQTLHFQLKEDVSHALAARQVADEVAHYKDTLERSRTKYKIVDETVQPDDSVIVRIIKQYNHSDTGTYLD